MSFTPKSIDHVRDDSVKELFVKEQQLQKQLNDIRIKIRNSRAKRDDLIEEQRPKKSAELDALEKQIDEQKALLSKLRSDLSDDSSAVKRALANKYNDHLQHAKSDMFDCERDSAAIVAKYTALSKEIPELKKNVERTKSVNTAKSMKELVTLRDNLRGKLKDATAKGNETVVKSLGKQLNELTNTKNKFVAYRDANEALTKANEDLEKLAEEAMKASDRMKKLEKEQDKNQKQVDKHRSGLAITDEERDAETKKKDAIRKQITELAGDKKPDDENKEYFRGSIYELVEKRKSLTQSPEVKAMKDEIDAMIEKKKALEEEEQALADKIPNTILKYDPEFTFDLIGAGGAVISQIEQDWGVLIDVRKNLGEIKIRGSENKDCSEAIEAILKDAKENRHKEKITIDPALTGEFIGGGGKRIQRFQSESSCDFNVDKASGEIEVIGTKENVARAKELIQEFLAESTTEKVTYDKKHASILTGRLMRKWQDEYECRTIRNHQDDAIISITGYPEKVKTATGFIKEFLEDMQVVHYPLKKGFPHHIVIGSGGATCTGIENKAKVVLDISHLEVKIFGAKANTLEAKKLIDALVSENIREDIKLPFPAKMRDFLLRRRPVMEGLEEEFPAADPRNAGGVCLLEQLRRKHNANSCRASPPPRAEILITAKKENGKELVKELKDFLEGKGMNKEVLAVGAPFVRYMTVRLNDAVPAKTRLTPFMKTDGLEEIIADFRNNSDVIELMGSKEAVDLVKGKIEEIQADVKERMGEFELKIRRIGRLLGGGNCARIEKEYGCIMFVPRTDRNKDYPADAKVVVTCIAESPDDLAAAMKDAEETVADY